MRRQIRRQRNDARRRTRFRRAFLWRAQAICLALSALLAITTSAEAQELELRILPPQSGLGRICERDQALARDRYDLTRWRDGAPPAPSDALLEIGDLYREGSATTPSDPELARRIYAYLAGRQTPGAAGAKYRLAQIMLAENAGPSVDQEAARLLREAVSARHGAAAALLAGLHETGRGAPQDFGAAAGLYRLAIVENRASAAFGLARLYQAGLVAEPAANAAQQMAQLGLVGLVGEANRGRCGALTEIARLYERGGPIRQDEPAAAAWHLAAAQAGDIRAMNEIAERLSGGFGVARDQDAALEWRRRAGALGSAEAALAAGRIYSGSGRANVAEAIRWLERAAAGGSAEAMERLAAIWAGRAAVRPKAGVDHAKAAAWLERALAAEPDRQSVLNALADIYETGEGVSVDLAKADGFRGRAARAGSLVALRKLADARLVGLGAPADPKRALEIYRQAAARGDAAAFQSIVDIYRCGVGAPQDLDLAARWLERGADQGVPRLMLELARRLLAKGAPEDLAARRNLLLRAAAAGSRDAMLNLAETYAAGVGAPKNAAEVARWRQEAIAPGPGQSGGLRALAAAILGSGPLAGAPAEARALLEQALKLGDDQAALDLFRLLRDGRHGLAAEPARATALLEEARARGVSGADRAWARLQREQGSPDQAIRLFVAAAKAGDDLARIELATLLARTGDAAEDLPAPSALLDEAAAGPPCNLTVIVALATAFADGVAGTDRRGEANRWIDLALNAFAPEPDRLRRLGQAAIDAARTDAEQARGLAVLESAAERGSIEAMIALFRIHRDGPSNEAGMQAARDWLQRAADSGDRRALYLYGQELAAGVLYPLDAALALRATQSAADRGDRAAMRELAKWRLVGFGGDPDPEAAVRWLEKAIALGDADAMLDLANIYVVGLAAAPEPSTAITLLKRAAEGGSSEAMLRLSAAFASGYGVPADPEAAAYWMEAAARSGAVAGSR